MNKAVNKRAANMLAKAVYIEELETKLGNQAILVERLAEKLAEMNIMANTLADNLYALVDAHDKGDNTIIGTHLARLSANRKAMQKGKVH